MQYVDGQEEWVHWGRVYFQQGINTHFGVVVRVTGRCSCFMIIKVIVTDKTGVLDQDPTENNGEHT